MKKKWPKRRTTGLGITSEGRKIGCERRSDILAEHQGYTGIDGKDTTGAQDHRDSHQCRRALDDTCEHRSDNKEQQNGTVAVGIEALEDVDKSLVVSQVHRFAGGIQCSQGEKHERYTEDKVADVAVTL